MLLSIIIPVFNETRTIKKIVDRVQSVQYPVPHEVIIVDDASTDRTPEKEILIKEKYRASGNIRIFKNRINRGKGFSIRKGIRRARGNFIIVQDADYEYNPNDIPKLIEPILKGESDVVYGSRFLGVQRPLGMAFPNYIANVILTQLTNWLFDLRLTDMETCYKAFKSETVKPLSLHTNRFTFEPEVTALLAKKGIRIMELPIGYQGRNSKEGKKIKIRDFFYAVLTLIGQRIKF